MAHRPAGSSSSRRRGALAGILAVALAGLLAVPTIAADADTTAPTLTLPADLTREATGPEGAQVAYDVSARDDRDRSVAVSCQPASGSTFPLGATTVACSAADRAGNAAQGAFTITVSDTTVPLLSLPPEVVAEASGPAGAVVWFAAGASDDVGGVVPVTCTPGPGPFPIGATRVECSAADPAGNRATGAFAVTVRDTTPPLVDIPDDIVTLAPGPDGALVSYVVSATDDVDGTVAPNCTPASGIVFPLGVRTVTCAAADAAGNRSSRSFRVTVSPPDVTPPLINVPREVVVEASGPNGAVVDYLAPADDDVDGPVPVSCSPASGTTFAIGSSTVTCSATDRTGNSDSRSFVVTVRDATPPLIELPAAPVVEAAGPDGAVVTYSASATDDVDGLVPVTCSIPSGATFALGVTTVSCRVSDAAGNAATRTFPVTVRDTVPPAISVPAGITVPGQSAAGAPVSYEATALDAVSGPVVASCAPSSGATFPPGTSEVRCVAADQAGNSASTSFSVTVGAPPASP